MRSRMAVAGAAAGLAMATAAVAADWTLVWSDEFDRDGAPDPAKWDYEVGAVRNNEAQTYTRARAENARVENGSLVIEARREPMAKKDYTSASVITRGRAHVLYCRIEIRAKLPKGRGVWPALWALGANRDAGGWPRCGEIDIMEMVGFDPEVIHTTVHTDRYNHRRGTQKAARFKLPGASDGFHVYAVEWHPDRLDFVVDGVRRFTFARESDDLAVWPFSRPHYLLMNLAIGGAWGGQKGIDESIFPQRMEVDYVRVYSNPAVPGSGIVPPAR